MWFFNQNDEPVKVEPKMAQEILPGGNRAIILLADGEKVDVEWLADSSRYKVDGVEVTTEEGKIRYMGKSNTKVEYNTIMIPRGGEYQVELSDGTKVWLNAETQLRIPTTFVGTERRVFLKGEAYFDVSKDAARPFIVEVNSLEVRVLGTAFNLRSYDDEGLVVTTLVEGKVEVAADEVVRTITPGMQVVYEKENGDMKVQKVDVLLYTAWQSGKFIFKNERLEDIMIYLSKWYGFNYRFIDNHAKEVRIGARLDRYDNMEPIIEMLKRTGLVNITQMDKMFYISSAK